MATVSISAVVGDNGIIAKAKLAKNIQANSIEAEQDAMDELFQEYANAMAGEGSVGDSTTEPEDTTVAVESVSLDKTSETIATNETLQLTMTVSPSNATNKNVTWSSSTPSVATVSQAGLVTPVAVGTTIITVTTEDGGKTASCSVTIEKPLTSTVTSTDHEGTETEDTLGNPVYIPGGFKIAEDSGETVKEGIVVEDASGNQFVWIPVSNINGDGSNKIKVDANTEVEITLGRYTFDTTTGAETIVQYAENYASTVTIESYYQELSAFRESTQSEYTGGTNATAKDLAGFINSVNTKKGYYLARYEASYASGTTFGVGDNSSYYKPASKVSTSKSTSSMSYAEGTLWNFITQGNASMACRQMYYGNEYIESDLVNSYAWDTAIVYIQAMGNSNYSNQTDGNGTLKNTGETEDEVCKIFDMASNCYEWTTEYSIYTNSNYVYPSTIRGGNYDSSSNKTSRRYRLYSINKNNTSGFRSVLYIK